MAKKPGFRHRLRWFVLLAAATTFAASAHAQGNGIRISGGAKNKPFVVLLPGSGGAIPSHWAGTVSGAGFAVVTVDFTSIFAGQSLLAVSENQMAATVATAVEAARQAGLDTNRYAVLGLSKGGTAALLARGATGPSAVFAFYPGSVGWCPNSHGGATKVHIFYGDADGWGNYRGTRDACKRQAGGNVAYHEYPGVNHGFDRPARGARQINCCGTSWIDEGNPAAAAKARGVVAATLRSIR